jgi:hypothetical protein
MLIAITVGARNRQVENSASRKPRMRQTLSLTLLSPAPVCAPPSISPSPLPPCPCPSLWLVVGPSCQSCLLISLVGHWLSPRPCLPGQHRSTHYATHQAGRTMVTEMCSSCGGPARVEYEQLRSAAACPQLPSSRHLPSASSAAAAPLTPRSHPLVPYYIDGLPLPLPLFLFLHSYDHSQPMPSLTRTHIHKIMHQILLRVRLYSVLGQEVAAVCAD